MSKYHEADAFFQQVMMPAGIGQVQALSQLREMQSGHFLRLGIEAFDKRMRLVPGEMVVIGGRPGSGKTAMGMQIVHYAKRQLRQKEEKGLIAVFSAEMTSAGLMMREAAAAADVAIERLTVGDATPEEYERVEENLKRQKNRDADMLYVDESPAPTLEHMVEQLENLCEMGAKLRLVMFDYMELAGEFGQSQAERVSKIARGLKAIAKRFNVPVVVLCQLNRDIEKRPEKKVFLSDFMFGGEAAADIAIGLLRPHHYDMSRPSNLVEAYICKYRNGTTGKVDLVFDSRTLRFSTGYMVRQPLNT